MSTCQTSRMVMIDCTPHLGVSKMKHNRVIIRVTLDGVVVISAQKPRGKPTTNEYSSGPTQPFDSRGMNLRRIREEERHTQCKHKHTSQGRKTTGLDDAFACSEGGRIAATQQHQHNKKERQKTTGGKRGAKTIFEARLFTNTVLHAETTPNRRGRRTDSAADDLG
jgi:hypothetical protein